MPPAPPLVRAALGRLEAVLATHGLRLTTGRRAIVDAILGRQGHFAIEELVEDLRARGLAASKATVYRALPLLTEAGIVQPAVVTGDEKSYERAAGRKHHDHLVCKGCGAVVEFEYDAIEILQREVAARHGFTLEGHMLQLLGRCPACRAKAALGQGAANPSHLTEEAG
jgi:Fur family ferric uptake transcriptional regulator